MGTSVAMEEGRLEQAFSEEIERVASEHDEEDGQSIHITVQRSDGSGELALVVNAQRDALEEVLKRAGVMHGALSMGGYEITSGSFEENGIEDGARLDLDVPSVGNMLAGYWYCRDEGADDTYDWITASTLVLKLDGRFESTFYDDGCDHFGREHSCPEPACQYHKGHWRVEPLEASANIGAVMPRTT